MLYILSHTKNVESRLRQNLENENLTNVAMFKKMTPNASE